MTTLHMDTHRSPRVRKLAAPTGLSGCAPVGHRAHMDSDSPRSTVRRHVRAEREQRGWSQSDLAKAAGVSRGTIANLESGMHLTEGKEAKIETALGKPIGWLDDIRAGRVTATADFNEPTPDTPPTETRADPPPGPVRQLRVELAYFHGRLRDTPEDYTRLLDLLDLYASLADSPLSTQGGTHIDAQG